MSDWRDFGGYPRAGKKPPPAHGIRMKKAGTTWWGQRWIEALEQVLSGDSGRLARGRTYARAGRTHDLAVGNGKVSANVTGSRPTPYKITIAVEQLSAAIWTKVISGMSAKAQFSAELLAGEMPMSIDDVFRDAGVSLFPRTRADLVTTCSCPDWGDPCKHVAAAHYVLGEAFDRDPFLLFELRGQTKDQVLKALRGARTSAVGTAKSAASKRRSAKELPAAEAAVTASARLAALDPRNYDRLREALPALHFGFEAPAVDAAVMRQLGAPTAWDGPTSPAELLSPIVRAAADAARRIAMAEQTVAAGEVEPGVIAVQEVSAAKGAAQGRRQRKAASASKVDAAKAKARPGGRAAKVQRSGSSKR